MGVIQNTFYEIESNKLFSESLIWQLSRDYYDKKGPDAWRQGTVPHHLTSNSMVGRTYAELIFGFLKDLAYKGQHTEKVYILELGAGHGRLAFHVLKHLERLAAQVGLDLPPYCYVLSDMVEDNLDFFQSHPQFQPYFKKGMLDLAYFDAIESKELALRYSGKTISPKDLNQPILAIANYFFDSLPKDLFHFKDNHTSSCSVALETSEDPDGMDERTLLKKMKLRYSMLPTKFPFYEQPILNEILGEYCDLVFDTYLFFPQKGLQCLDNILQLSKKGLMVISMDKGSHEIHELENAPQPEMITHGSMSFDVNYHAYGAYCEKKGGSAFFPTHSNFHLELGCLLFLGESESYHETRAAYHRVVNEYGPDDFNGFKKFTYKHIATMSLMELVGMLRLGAYDSTLFINVLPRLKQVALEISVNDRARLAQTMHETWNMYFTLNETHDLAFEIGGLFYSLGYYEEALDYFQFSINRFGHTADEYYNRALCHYQLRQDELFVETVIQAKALFPDYKKFAHLDTLDLGAE